MAHSTQAKKRIRQNQLAQTRNKSVASAMRSSIKKLQQAIETGDREAANGLLISACSRIDKAAKTHVIHANNASRKKSQIMRAVNAMK